MSSTENSEVTDVPDKQPQTLTALDTLGESFGEITDDVPSQGEESENVNLPSCFDYSSEREKPWEVQLWKGACLDCNALIPGSELEGLKQRCHFSNGNNYCPAKETQFVFVGQKMSLVEKFKKAKASGDHMKVALALSKIQEEEDEATRIAVMKEIGLLS